MFESTCVQEESEEQFWAMKVNISVTSREGERQR